MYCEWLGLWVTHLGLTCCWRIRNFLPWCGLLMSVVVIVPIPLVLRIGTIAISMLVPIGTVCFSCFDKRFEAPGLVHIKVNVTILNLQPPKQNPRQWEPRHIYASHFRSGFSMFCMFLGWNKPLNYSLNLSMQSSCWFVLDTFLALSESFLNWQ